MSNTRTISEKPKRIYRSLALMSPLIEAWLQSSIPKGTYCNSLGIPVSTFNYWLDRYVPPREDLASDNVSSEGSCLVPLTVESSCSLAIGSSSYELVYPNGVHLHLPSSIDLDRLHRLLLSP